jgi:hypothetical protein
LFILAIDESVFNIEILCCTENHLIGTLSDLYFAGSDTTSSTLSWMVLYLSKMPHIQKKFQDEIEAITGNTRHCSVNDRPK